MRDAKWSGTVSKFPIKLGDHERHWDAQQRGFLGLEKVLGSLFADTRHPGKKKRNLQASLKAGPVTSWQSLKAAVESGGLSIRPDYNHSQSWPTASIKCQVPMGVQTTHRSCPFHIHHILVRRGRYPPTTNGQTEAQRHLTARQ